MIASAAVVAGAMVLGGGATEPTPAATEEVKSPAAVSQQASVGEGTSTGQPTAEATSWVPSGIGVPTVPFAQPTQSTQEPSADSTAPAAPGLAPVTPASPTQVPSQQSGGFGSWIFPLFIGQDGRPTQPTQEQQSGFMSWFQGLFGSQPQITAPAPQAPAQGVPAPSSDPTLGLALPGAQPTAPSESATGGGEVAGDSQDHNSEEGQDKAGESDQGGGQGQDDGKDSKSESDSDSGE